MSASGVTPSAATLRPRAHRQGAASTQERFERFHAQNPRVYAVLKRIALDVWASGRERYGFQAVWQRARWHFSFEQAKGESFVLNNNYASRYARLLMQNEPELHDFFPVRKLHS
jgi:hypothetical protein